MSDMPTPGGMSGPSGMQPHRGTLILVLGILGLLVCQILGIVAWVMGNGDLRAMQEGRMDPTGEGMTKAGKILGIISVVLLIVGVGLTILMMAIGGFAAAASANSVG